MNAGIYIRTSTVRQGEEGTSLKTQEEQARLKATELGYQVYPEHIWIDMESGADLERTGVNRMLQAVRHREVDMVVVYDHDRLSRDPLDLLNIQRVFIDAAVSLEFVRGPSDTSPEGQLMTYFMGYAAQRERLQFKERTMRGKEQAARDGRMPSTGGVGLYGYDYNPALRQRTINETEAEVVRMMFQRAMEGVSMYRIACMLNEKKIPSKTGKLWSQDRVRRTLQNQAYTGTQYYGKFRHRRVKGGKKEIIEKPDSEAILVQGFTPQLVTPEFFEAVQQRLAASPGRWRKKAVRYMMSGFTKCGKCGSAVVGSMLAAGHRYYRCNRSKRQPGVPAICDARNIRADRLEETAWRIVSEAIRHPEIISRQIERHAETGDGDPGKKMTKLRREIADLKNQQRRLLEQRQKDIIDQELLESQIAPVKLLCDEKERLLGALEGQQKRKDAVADAEKRIAEYCGRLAEGLDNLDQEGKRATFGAFGVKVEATPDDLSVILEIDPAATIIQPSSAQSRRLGGHGGTTTAPRRRKIPFPARCPTSPRPCGVPGGRKAPPPVCSTTAPREHSGRSPTERKPHRKLPTWGSMPPAVSGFQGGGPGQAGRTPAQRRCGRAEYETAFLATKYVVVIAPFLEQGDEASRLAASANQDYAPPWGGPPKRKNIRGTDPDDGSVPLIKARDALSRLSTGQPSTDGVEAASPAAGRRI